MRSEDEGRTEEPSEGLRERARKEGRVACSADLAAAAGLSAGILALIIGAPPAARETDTMFQSFWGSVASAGKVNGLEEAFAQGFGHFCRLAALPVVAIFAGTLVAGLVQTGFRLFPAALKPEFRRLGRRSGAASRGRTESPGRLYETIRPFLRTLSILVAALATFPAGLRRIVAGAGNQPGEAFSGILSLAGQFGLACAAILLVSGIADWLYRRRLLFDSLKLTPAQQREEKRREEGDPAQKAMIRRRMRDRIAAQAIRKTGEGERR